MERREIPRRFVRRLEWHLAFREREQALARSGLPECEWVRAWAVTLDSGDLDKNLQALDTHTAACEMCKRRAQFEEQLGPLPAYPMGYGIRLIGFVVDFLEAPTRGQWAIRIVASVVALLFIASLFRFLPYHQEMVLLVYLLAMAILAILVFGIYHGLQNWHERGAMGRWLARCVAGGTAMVGFMAAFPVAGYGGELLHGEPFPWGEGILLGVAMGLAYATAWPIGKYLIR